ncbi:peroxisome proliferator-activated receptor gamma coactivator-related protein 1 isoform A [Patagioenas fasciata monilis]|uniref:Peroxisome proliferator-activated receptor gamma coactivator-related protein 1 n=1 Tax=Patagioenas fasciata monilis TaxID=372326 RepID=A0A1V4KIP4_PATFA|nr:peroxisome proliferator-activated receptor gamma coactivator-related protein 1 isoform A [Patagioenas fasciata monilis]
MGHTGGRSPLQCFSLEENDLNLMSLDAETILEAEEILGTMQNYLDSSVISIIEDLSLSEQSKACLDVQNELSLLTAITEILDSTDDETLSPFDTIMDAELLSSPRERENPSVSCEFQKFLSLSRPSLEYESAALEQPKALRPLSSSSIAVVGKTDTDLAWDHAAHDLEDQALPKKQVCTPRMERKLGRNRAREQPLPQRSDGEEEEEEVEAALSPALDSSVEVREFCGSGARAELEDREDPCIINTGDVSLSELVKSMHPYCLPTFTVCLDPETEPVAKELLSGPILLEIVPEDPEEFPGTPAQENKMEEKKEKPPGKEPSCTTPESTSPLETAAPSTRSPGGNSRHSTKAPLGTKCKGSEKGRGRERARKSRKKKAEDQSEQARPGRECVSDFLAQQLERARKEGQMELRAEPPPRPQGRPPSMAGASPPEKVQKETMPEVVTVALEKAETVGPPEKTAPSVEERPAAVCPNPEDHAEPSEVLPKEAKPKALSLREYRIRMLHRQPSPAGKAPAAPASAPAPAMALTVAPPPPKAGRESSLPTKAPAVRPWRHQPLLSPVQPSDSSKDIVQAFISEIGIEATDLSSLLEQFEKSEAKKEAPTVQPPEDQQLAGNSAPETQQDRKPLDGLQASELANVAGLTPPATPPHQLWKPLPTVSLLAKAKSPGSMPQEGPQKMTKLTKTKPLLQSKLQGKSPAPASSAPSHVCSGDHDYCILASTTTVEPSQESPGSASASPCRDQEVRTPSAQPSRASAKSSSSDGASESSSSSSSRSRSRSFSPPPKRWRRYRSRCSRSSSSHSSCGSCGRSRDRSSSSSSTSSYSSRSTSRSQSRSPSPHRRSNRRRRYSYDAQDHYQRQRILQKERAIEERRVVFIGKIPSRMTRSELRHRFSVFGDIEECTLHFRSEGDNYGFVTYRYAEEAFAAIESGHKLRRPDEQPFDLCFGGRRQFCRRNYADLDSNREDFDPAPVKSKFDSLDFDTLLRQAQRSLRR